MFPELGTIDPVYINIPKTDGHWFPLALNKNRKEQIGLIILHLKLYFIIWYCSHEVIIIEIL